MIATLHHVKQSTKQWRTPHETHSLASRPIHRAIRDRGDSLGIQPHVDQLRRQHGSYDSSSEEDYNGDDMVEIMTLQEVINFIQDIRFDKQRELFNEPDEIRFNSYLQNIQLFIAQNRAALQAGMKPVMKFKFDDRSMLFEITDGDTEEPFDGYCSPSECEDFAKSYRMQAEFIDD